MIGSGLCVFSKIPIEETLFHKFDLNGYAHKVHHGDWFGGKGVGLVKLSVEGLKINLYISHVSLLKKIIIHEQNKKSCFRGPDQQSWLTAACNHVDVEPYYFLINPKVFSHFLDSV